MHIYSSLKAKGFVSLLDQTKPAERKKQEGVHIVHFKNLSILYSLNNTLMIPFGITLTFKKSFHSSDSRWLHDYFQSRIEKCKVAKLFKYQFYPEFSSKNCHLHYHGIIYSTYQVHFIEFVKWYTRSFGYCKPELEIYNYWCEKKDSCITTTKRCWLHYITKDCSKTGLYPIVKY